MIAVGLTGCRMLIDGMYLCADGVCDVCCLVCILCMFLVWGMGSAVQCGRSGGVLSFFPLGKSNFWAAGGLIKQLSGYL